MRGPKATTSRDGAIRAAVVGASLLAAAVALAAILYARNGRTGGPWGSGSGPASAERSASTAPVAGHATSRPAAGHVPLVLQLPRPRYTGTPVNLRSPNLGKPGPRPELRVPAGVTNVALGKPATASDVEPTLGELRQVTDGDKEGLEGSYVEIGAGRQFFQVDLQRTHRIHAVVVWHYHAQARVYHDVVVQASDDPSFATGVRTLFNNDHDGSLGLGAGRDKEYIDGHEGLLIDAQGVVARHVRLYGNGNTENDLNHCTEIEVHGAVPSTP